MPSFTFQVYDGHTSVAPQSLDLPDVIAARREGIRRAGATLVLDAHKLTSDDAWHLDVTDAAGMLLYRFDFSMTIAPAARR